MTMPAIAIPAMAPAPMPVSGVSVGLGVGVVDEMGTEIPVGKAELCDGLDWLFVPGVELDWLSVLGVGPEIGVYIIST